MRPTRFFILILILSIIVASSTYILYPIDPEEGYGIVRAVAGYSAPSFAVGVVGVGSIDGNISVRGIVTGHGVLNVNGYRIPYMIVESDGRSYRVIMGYRFLKHLGVNVSEIRVGRAIKLPMHMSGAVILVRGVLIKDTNIIIARGIKFLGHHPMMPHMGHRR